MKPAFAAIRPLRRGVVALAGALVLLAACGKKEPVAAEEAYGLFKYRNTILRQAFPGGRTLDGSIDIDASRDATGPSDWTDVAVNGDVVGRTTGSSRVTQQVRFRPGPNKVSFFCSAALRYWEFDVDARQGTRVEITPKEPKEYDIVQRKDE